MFCMAKRWLSWRDGTTAIEYALIAALISLSIIGALTTVGTTLNTAFFTAIAAMIGTPAN